MRHDRRAARDGFLAKIAVRPVVMGILNVTPDSFSDGGRYQSREAAIAHAKRMVAEGCDIVDVGAESARPGATPVSEAEELARLEPILSELAHGLDAPLSIDTSKARVAARATQIGAVVINDVWGLQHDPAMADVAAASGAAVVIVHNRVEKDPAVDILSDIRRFFDHSLALAAKAGILRELLILDPGIGFAKSSRQNVEAVAGIAEFKDYGLPILVGLSRKSFLGSLIDRDTEANLIGTIAASLAAAASGAVIFRVHDVSEHVAALKVFHTIRGTAGGISPRTR
jgi:dihydropteroate synthase